MHDPSLTQKRAAAQKRTQMHTNAKKRPGGSRIAQTRFLPSASSRVGRWVRVEPLGGKARLKPPLQLLCGRLAKHLVGPGHPAVIVNLRGGPVQSAAHRAAQTFHV